MSLARRFILVYFLRTRQLLFSMSHICETFPHGPFLNLLGASHGRRLIPLHCTALIILLFGDLLVRFLI
jgi:hypothetical protein